MDELNGVALSQEELLVALLIAKLPALAGFDDLEARVFRDLPESFRPMLLAAGERSLMARGALALTEAAPELEGGLLQMIHTCAKPERTWLLMHQPRGGTERSIYVHQAAQIIAHTEAFAIHQLVELNGTGDLRTIVGDLIGIGTAVPVAGLRGVLAEAAFAQATASEDPAAALASQLRAGGLVDDVAASFAESISQRAAITACALFEHQREPALQQIFTIIASPTGHWAISPHAAGTIQIQQVDGALLLEALDRLGAVAKTHS